MEAKTELSEQVKRQMNRLPIHDSWEASYRTAGNEKTYEVCFDRFVKVLEQPTDSKALDIGCGICANSVRLARRGYRVTGGDYSEVILEPARQNIARHELPDRIAVQREDILALSFPSDSFDLVLCWGVLMHIPLAGKALNELVRVTKPGGYLVFEEINAGAPEARGMRLFWRLLRSGRIQSVKNETGFEQTSDFAHEKLFWRHTDPHWLEDQMRLRLCELAARQAGLFTERAPLRPAAAREESGACVQPVLDPAHQKRRLGVSQYLCVSERASEGLMPVLQRYPL